MKGLSQICRRWLQHWTFCFHLPLLFLELYLTFGVINVPPFCRWVFDDETFRRVWRKKDFQASPWHKFSWGGKYPWTYAPPSLRILLTLLTWALFFLLCLRLLGLTLNRSQCNIPGQTIDDKFSPWGCTTWCMGWGAVLGIIEIDWVIPLVSSNETSDGALLDPGFPLSSSADTLCTSVSLDCAK